MEVARILNKRLDLNPPCPPTSSSALTFQGSFVLSRWLFPARAVSPCTRKMPLNLRGFGRLHCAPKRDHYLNRNNNATEMIFMRARRFLIPPTPRPFLRFLFYKRNNSNRRLIPFEGVRRLKRKRTMLVAGGERGCAGRKRNDLFTGEEGEEENNASVGKWRRKRVAQKS